MFCPNCAAKNSTEQRFCRACGMNLEQTAATLEEQFPARKGVELDRAGRRLERFGQIAFGGFGIVVAIAILGIIYAIVTKMILAGTQPIAGVILVLFLIFAALTLAYVVFAEDLKEKRKEMMKAPAAGTVAADSNLERDTNNLLSDPINKPVPSVIEDTTDLLPVEKKTRKL